MRSASCPAQNKTTRIKYFRSHKLHLPLDSPDKSITRVNNTKSCQSYRAPCSVSFTSLRSCFQCLCSCRFHKNGKVDSGTRTIHLQYPATYYPTAVRPSNYIKSLRRYVFTGLFSSMGTTTRTSLVLLTLTLLFPRLPGTYYNFTRCKI
jgi:hypothetical protein